MSWREFELRIEGLLHCDSRIYRYLTSLDDDIEPSKEVDEDAR